METLTLIEGCMHYGHEAGMSTEKVVSTHVATEDAESTCDVHNEHPVKHLPTVPTLRGTLHRGETPRQNCGPHAEATDHQTDPSYCQHTPQHQEPATQIHY